MTISALSFIVRVARAYISLVLTSRTVRLTYSVICPLEIMISAYTALEIRRARAFQTPEITQFTKISQLSVINIHIRKRRIP